MNAIFCGASKPPKGKRHGSMIECIQKGQLRRFGLNKVDKKTLKLAKATKKTSKKKQQRFKKVFMLRGKRKKLMKDLDAIKNDRRKKKEADELKDQIKKVTAELKAISGLQKK